MKLEKVKRFFALLENFSDSEADFREILHPEVRQTEYPNSLTDRVVVSDFGVLLQRIPKGKALLSSQSYDIRNTIESQDTLVVEAEWTATVGVDAGTFRAGQKLKAYFCCIFEFKDGLIVRQRNYDCFERFV